MLQASFRKLNIEKVSWNSRLIINAVFLECGTGPPGQTEVSRQPWILPVVRSNIIRLVWKFRVLPNAISCAWRPFLSCRQRHNQENNQPIINQLTLDKENYKPGSRSFSTWTAKLKDWRATTLWQVSTYRVFFFNWSARFSVPKWKKLAQPMRSFFTFEFFLKVSLVGCNLFFILVLKIERTS